MVSPSKIIKTSNYGFNFDIVGSKKDGLRTNGGSKLKVSSISHLGHSQLLSNTRFYLDIRNKFQLDKAEELLKAYGAKIEVFFVKDVEVIVTDKPEWMGYGNSPSSSVSPLTTPSPVANQEQRFVVPKSRAYAMLEKVSQQPASSCSSPLELAQKWRIPVLSVRSLRKWIGKIEEAYMTELKEKKREKVLESKIEVSARDRAPFIKIESIISRNLPEFLVLESWPSLNLDGRLGQCPFYFPSTSRPTLSNAQPQEVKNKLYEVKDKVAVELIQYDTDFRIRDNVKLWECEEGQGEQVEVSENRDLNNTSLKRVGFISVTLNIKMTRRPAKNSAINNDEEATKITDSKQRLSPVFNGYPSRGITRQSSQELLKVQCNGLTTGHRNSKLLSPSGSDVLPLPSSRRSTRRASASWCGSTRELSQLSPTDSEIENIRRSDSSLEGHEPTLDSPGITLRPKGQLWLPIALIGTTAEENGNCIRKRFEYSIKQSENAKLSNDLLDSFNEKAMDETEANEVMQRVSKESEYSVNTNGSQTEFSIKKNNEKKDSCAVMVTRHSRVRNEEVNGRSREGSIDTHPSSDDDLPSNRIECKKRSLSACDRTSPTVKRVRTMSTNSVHSIARKKKLSPEEKLLQDNKDYFKMEVLNTKLRSTGSLLTVNQCKESETSVGDTKSPEKLDKITIRRIGFRRRRRRRTKVVVPKKPDDPASFVKKPPKLRINGALKRKRQTELMKLCNEAESFMFGEPNRHGPILTKATEMESSDGGKRKFDTYLLTKPTVQAPVETPTNVACENGVKRRRKRRSHAEAFIHDNIDYYKFEAPASRLRYQGNLTDGKSEDKEFVYTLKQRKKEAKKKEETSETPNIIVDIKEEKTDTLDKKKTAGQPSEGLERLLFSFESIPVTEPWYEVYKRQDEGLENYYPLLSSPSDQPFLLPYELPKTVYSKSSSVSEYYKKRRKRFLHLFNHPRKSPRCHASTLAILSSLKKRKRRSGTNISANQIPSESSPPPPQQQQQQSQSQSQSQQQSQPNNLNVSEEKLESQKLEREKKEFESEEILNFLYTDDGSLTDEEVCLEPYSDSETKSISPGGRSDDEDGKNQKTCNRGRKPAGKGELTSTDQDSIEREKNEDGGKCFSWQKINPDDFFAGMGIKAQKKSGLVVNIAHILENYKNCTSMEDSEAGFKNKSNEERTGRETTGRGGRRRKRKARKINKTGWDNRKSRRRTNNKGEVKDFESDEVKENLIKTNMKVRDESKNYLVGSGLGRRKKKRTRGREAVGGDDKDDRPVLRSHLDVSSASLAMRRTSQDGTPILDQEYPSYLLRVKKANEAGPASNFRLRCSRGRYSLQKRRLVLKRKKKRVRDYAWTTKTR